MQNLLNKNTSKLKRIAIIFVIVIGIILFGTLMITDPAFFRGEVLEYLGGGSLPTGVGDAYIPNNYQARVSEIGEIEVLAIKEIESLNALSFDLKFNTSEVKVSEIVLSGTPLAQFQSSYTEKPWGVTITLVNAYGVQIPANTAICKIKVQLSDNLDEGTEIRFTTDNVELHNEDLELVSFSIGEGKIFVVSGQSQSTEILLDSVTPNEIEGETEVTIKGANFEQPKVYIGSKEIEVVSFTGTEIIALVKDVFEPSVYSITIKNSNGVTKTVKNMVVITNETQRLHFIEEDFTTTPDRVSPDNESIITLWVSVDDPRGVSDIDKVTANLTVLGKDDSTAEFTPGNINEGKRWYFLETTVPHTLPTSDAPYQVPVTVTNMVGDTDTSFIEVLVSDESPGSVAPNILQASITPATGITAGSKVSFIVHVEDKDGVSNIKDIALDLVSVNGEPVLLKETAPEEVGESNDDYVRTQFYILRDYKLQNNLKPGSYTVKVTARDKTGKESFRDISFEIVASSEDAPQIIDSYAVPADGIIQGKEASFYVNVKDNNGSMNINETILDLGPIGGKPVKMVKGIKAETKEEKEADENTVIVDGEDDSFKYDQWFAYEGFSVPTSVKDGEYNLKIKSSDMSGLVGEGVLKINVSSAEGSPDIIDAYSSPKDRASRGKKISFFANVRDFDGLSDLSSIIVDLGPIGGGPTEMESVIDETESVEQWYELRDFVVPASIHDDKYYIIVKATDKSGLSSTKSIKLEITSKSGRPDILKMYTQPTDEIVPGGKMSFYAYVQDDDGASDIDNVMVNLIALGGAPTPMKKLSVGSSVSTMNTVSSDTSKTEKDDSIENTIFETEVDNITYSEQTVGSQKTKQWYALIDYPLSIGVTPGKYNVPITVTDRSGNSYEQTKKIKVVSPDDFSGLAPVIDLDKSYTTPRIGINDGETPMSIYVFVRHAVPLENVVINLGNIAKSTVFNKTTKNGDIKDSVSIKESAEDPCSLGSNVILCMNKTATEGSFGTWYKLEDIVINKETYPSDEPYRVNVVATDTNGRIGDGDIFINVGSQTSIYSDANNLPKLKLAVATSKNEIEVMFSKPIDPDTLKKSSFSVTEYNDINKKVIVQTVTLNASHNIAIIKTGDQEPGTVYSVSVDDEIKDSSGKSIQSGNNNKARFIGFQSNSSIPVVRTVTSLSSELVEIVFTNPIKPSSLDLSYEQDQAITKAPRQPQGHLYYSGENFLIRDVKDMNELRIKQVRFGDDAHIVLLETEVQQSSIEYLLSVNEIANYGGNIARKGSINKYFKGYVSTISDAPAVRRAADLNGDGNVDFMDFTIFASFYGKKYGGEIDDFYLDEVSKQEKKKEEVEEAPVKEEIIKPQD